MPASARLPRSHSSPLVQRSGEQCSHSPHAKALNPSNVISSQGNHHQNLRYLGEHAKSVCEPSDPTIDTVSPTHTRISPLPTQCHCIGSDNHQLFSRQGIEPIECDFIPRKSSPDFQSFRRAHEIRVQTIGPDNRSCFSLTHMDIAFTHPTSPHQSRPSPAMQPPLR